MIKRCVKCNSEKDIALFPKRGNNCKACVAHYMKEYRTNNAKHISELKKTWKQRNKEHVKELSRQYALANPEKRSAARLKWILNNPQQNMAAKTKYKLLNPHKVKEAKKTWATNNKPAVRAKDAKRRASTIQRTPKWLGHDELWLIKEAYHLAEIRTHMTGFVWHVDHIIPLQGKIVSGLHVIENLQVIPGMVNVRKTNKYELR